MSIFTEDDFDRLSGPHVARLWFAEIDLPSGLKRAHNGVGRITVGEREWLGVTDPLGGQLVSVTAVEDPRFGQAPSVVITLGGVSAQSWKEIKQTAREIEGRRCDLYWAAFDPETGEIDVNLKKLFPGKVSAPELTRAGIGLRNASFTIESIWQSQNYPFGGRWNASDQERRYPGDKGGQFIGVEVTEIFNT
ncbi:transcriptional regulator [Chelativorans sp. AA-79]|uniref:transcriptional regulator n=1 Tax=Chelativorans sp. AA-79 TaxID=3028735 RepID=UPI0023F8F502|nr:transcriptional regulator [Chelativorans sp. AA-79]WEX10273.1 transcriptional regulator [Chelativorans sp. AA-79]